MPGSTKVRHRSLRGCPSTRTPSARRPPACQALCAAASISSDCPSCASKRRTSNRSMGRRSAALHRQLALINFLWIDTLLIQYAWT